MKERFQLYNYILTRAHTHLSLKYAINVAIQCSWLKLWDIASDYGAEGTRHVLAILRALTIPLFGDGKCPAPWCTNPVIKNANTLFDHVMEHHWTNVHPSTPETLIEQVSYRQSRKSSASWPVHSQNSVYTITVNLLYLCV